MLNIKQELQKLLKDAPKAPKYKITDDKPNLIAEDKEVSFQSTKGPEKLNMFISYFLETAGIVSAVSSCLSTAFDPKTDVNFKKAIGKIVQFYNDFYDSYTSTSPTGLVEELLPGFHESVREFDREEYGKTVNYVWDFVEEFFTKGTPTVTIIPQDPDDLRNELTAFYVACNILYWYSLTEYYKADGIEPVLSLTNGIVNKPDYLQSKDFQQIGSPRPGALKDFLNSNTSSSEYIIDLFGADEGSQEEEGMSWSEIERLEAAESDKKKAAIRKREKEREAEKEAIYKAKKEAEYAAGTDIQESRYIGDVGSVGFLETFVKLSTEKFLSSVLLNEEPLIDAKSILAGRGKDKRGALALSALESVSGLNAPGASINKFNAPVGQENEDKLDELHQNLVSNPYEAATDEETYSKYWSDIKALETAFGVDDSSSNLSLILTDLFAKLLDNYFKTFGAFYITDPKTGNITATNIFSELKKLAISGKRDCIKEISEILTFIKDRDSFSAAQVKEDISELPETLQDGYDAYIMSAGTIGTVIGDAGSGKIVSEIKDPAADRINSLYNDLCKVSPAFRVKVSPSLTSPIKDKDLDPNSEFCKKFGIDVVAIDEETGGLVVSDTLTQQKRARTPKLTLEKPTQATNQVSQYFDRYIQTVQQIMNPDLKNNSVWGVKNILKTKDLKKYTAFPITDNEGNDITPIDRKGNKSFIYSNQQEYIMDANKVISSLKLLKPQFLSVKTVEELQALLTQVISNIPVDKRGILAFSSPGTVTVDNRDSAQKATLKSLLDPTSAITEDLYKIVEFPNLNFTGGKSVSPFLSFARLALQLNNMSTTESRILNTIFSVFETTTTKITSPEYIRYAVVNMYLRAQVLVAIDNLFAVITQLLGMLRSILSKLPEDVLLSLRAPVQSGISGFTADVCGILANAILAVLTQADKISAETVFAASAQKILTMFDEAEKRKERRNQAIEATKLVGRGKVKF
jgi:hypothetical protein